MPTFSPLGSELRIAAKPISLRKSESYLRARMPPVRALAALLAAVSLQCAAAPFALQVGDVRLGFDVPPGFADSIPTGSPRILDLAESLTPATNRILVFALTDGDMRRFNSGDAPELRQYLLVVIPKSLEQERMAPATFERYVGDGRRAMGTPIEGDFAKVLEARQPGDLALIADVLREPDVMSVIRALRLPPPQSEGLFSKAKPSQYVLSSTTVILLRGKALTLTLTSGYEGKGDVDWLRATTLRWIEDLRRLNVSR